MIKNLQDSERLINQIMNNKVLKTVKKYNMLSKGDRVLIGVSGGADSIALLEFFVSVKEKYDLDICVAH